MTLIYTALPSVTDVTARAIDSSTILVGWKLVQHPQAKVYRGVDIEYREMAEDGGVVSQRIQRYYGRGSSLYIRELNSGTTYQVQVLARTDTPDYVPSDVVSVTTDPEIPEAPYNLKTTSVSHSEIAIKWETRTALERLSGFSISITDVATRTEQNIRVDPATSSTYNIPDLQEDTEYEISVSSWIRGDQGNRSIPLIVRTKHFAPDAPPNVDGVSINATAARVTWGLPEDRYARSYIIGHHIKYEELYPSPRFTESKTASVEGGTQVVLTSLSENTTYKIQVSAYTIHTEGKLSAPILVKTLVSPQPVDLQPRLVSHNSIHLSWDAPIILRDITAFNVYVRDRGRDRQTKTRIPPEKEHTIIGLHPDTHYIIRVSSNYLSRESDLSLPLEVVTMSYVPPPPTNILALPVNETAILVEWTTINDPLVNSYHVTWDDMDRKGAQGQNVRVKGGKALIAPVMEDTSYRVRVRAETETQKGEYSKPTIVTTLESDKPIGLRASNIQFNQAELSWYAPIEKRNITDFRLVVTDVRTGTVIRETLPGDAQYHLKGLFPDTLYTVTIRSRMGPRRGKISDEYQFRTLPFVPDAPADVVSVPVNDTAVMVTWTPTLTDETRGYVVRYNVAYKEVGNGKANAVQVAGDTNLAVITSLDADTSYRMVVRAETLTEEGTYSQPSRIKTMVSDKPQKLKTTQVRNNQVDVSWQAPISDRNIIGFHFELVDGTTGEVTRETTGPTSGHTIRELEPDRKYTLTVKSLLENIEGKTSEALEFKTLPYVPEAPVDIVATPLHDTAVLLKWTPTLTDDNRRYVVRYHIAYNKRGKKEGKDDAGSVEVSGETNMVVITSLTADTSYRMRVRADTLTEEGEYSQPRVVKTLKSDKPRKLKTSRMKFNQAVLSWYAPIRDRNIIGFDLALTDVTTGRVTHQSIPVTSRHVLSDLEPDRLYKVALTSLLAGQNGKTSDVLEFKTQPYVPEPPKNIITTTLNDTAVKVEWTPTVDDDTRRYIVRYHITYNDEGSDGERNIQVPENAVMGIIGSLDADTSYNVRVRAETQTEKGEYSQARVARTFVSDRPQSLRTTDIQFNQAQISWYAPVKDRKITGFQIEATDLTTGETIRETLPPTLGYVLKGLEPARKYTLQVRSELRVGIGKESNVLEFETLPFVPKPPVSVVATALHDTAIQIQWTPTVDDETRKYIVRYNIAYNEQGSPVSGERSVQVGKDDVNVAIESLVADTSYGVRVRAETPTEEGEYSEPVVVKTLLSDKPRSLRTTDIQFNQADVSWYAPINERSIINFELVLGDVTTKDVTQITIPPTSHHSFRGLEPDRGYTLTVKSILPEIDGKISDVLEFRTVPYVPKPPVSVVATALHDTAIQIQWTPTVDDKTRKYIVRYNIAYSEQGSPVSGERSVQVGKDEVTVAIESLVADSSYRVRVRAETPTEEGEYTEPVVVKTLESDKPRALRTTELKFNQADVSWYAPIKERDITGFELMLNDVTSGDITHITTPPTSRHTFRGLKPDRGYTLTVKSVMADIDGKTSDVLEFNTEPYIPEAPADVIINPLHDTALLVNWTPTVDDETRAYVVRYHIAYNELNTEQLESIEVTGETNTATISGLMADTSYRVRVRAETLTEEGHYSEAKIVQTLVSDKPQSLRTSGLEFNEVEVTWYAQINARNISGFQLELSDVMTGQSIRQDIPTTSRYTLTGLEPDRKYTLTVTSLFEDEKGKASDVLEFRTSPFVPDAPVNMIATPIDDTALQLEWTPTVDDNTRRYIVNYDIVYSKQGTGNDLSLQVAGDASSAIISGLDADTSYGARVRAVTETEEGLYTNPVFAKTHQSDKPRGLKTFGIQFNQAELSWYAPIAQRGITGFLLVLNDLLTKDVSRSTIPANSRYTLTKLTAEHTYTVTLTSMFGEKEGKTSEVLQFKTLPFVPKAPEDVLLSPLNDTAVLVEWTPPVNEETQVYVVRYYIAYNQLGKSERVRDRESVEAVGDAAMAVINDLKADTSYRVSVRAETKTQEGALSEAEVVRTLKSDQPRGLKTVGIEFGQAEISWYAPTEQRNITSFILNLKDLETGEVTHQVGSGKTRQTVTGLKADRKYTLTITSMLGDQVGKTSDKLEFKTKPFVPPVIEEATVTPLNQSTILVQWKNPDDAGSREYITLYSVEYGELDRYRRVQNPSTLQHRGKEGRAYVTGLTEDTDYRIRVRAETDTQKGLYTRTYITKTLMSEQPRELTATDIHYSSITLSWTAPIEQRNITRFNVYTFDTILGEEHRHEIPPKLSFRIDNLKPDRVYGIRVSAMIGEKEGQSSSNIEIKTDPYIPRAPTDVKSHPVNATAVYVEWKAPDDLFARQYVIGFNILYDKSRSKLPVEKWGLLEYYGGKENSLITSLEPDTEYNVMVRVNTKTEKGHLSRQISVKTMVSAEPMNLRTPRVTFDQFDLTWDAPVKERNISAFAVYLTDTTFNGRTREEILPIQKHTLDSLSPSTIYLAEVASILASGEGIVSAAISVETMPFVPDAPTSVQATSYNFSSITFDWQLAKDPASLMYIKGCHILYTNMIEGGETRQEVLLGQVESSVLSTLEEDSSYRVQIRAFSDTAEGKLSRPIIISTPPAIPDWSPDLLTATVEYDNTVRLEWYVQSPKAQLDQTLKYEAQYFRQPDPYSDMYVSELVSGPTIIDSLETHSTYSFRIRAYSSSGRGPWSSSLEATLDGPDLGKVRIARVNRTDPYSSKTRWIQQGVGEVPIKGFRIYYTPIDYKFEPVPGQRYVNSVGARSRLDTMRSLRPEQYYFVQVAAFSDHAVGRRSNVSFLPDMDYPRIALGPKNKKIAAELAVSFSCQITGEPGYTVYWKKGNVRITRRHVRFEYKMVNSTSLLRIKQTRPRDSAEYTCILNVNGTLYTRKSTLDVYDQTEIPSGYPSFTRNPSLTSVETGSNTSFICAAAGVPVPEISWYKNNVPIQQSIKFVVTQIGRESRLWILNATLEDVGKYVCSAENRHGTIYNFDAQLYVKVKKSPPVFITTPEDMFVQPGSEVNLTCVVEGEPIPVMRWLENGAYMDALETLGRGELILPEVYVTTEYTCEAENSEGQATSSARVQVDSTSNFKGVVLQEPRNRTVFSGSSVSFQCSGAGRPKPNIYWERDGQRLSREDFGKSYYLEEKDGVSVLEIRKVVGRRDQGTFSCTVENSLGYSDAPAVLTVLKRTDIPTGYPNITKHTVVTAVARGQTTNLFCGTDDPAALITWYKDRFILTSTKRLTITTKDGSSQLRIKKAGEKDYGKYHCSAENQHGIVYSKRAMLYIRRVSRQRR